MRDRVQAANVCGVQQFSPPRACYNDPEAVKASRRRCKLDQVRLVPGRPAAGVTGR